MEKNEFSIKLGQNLQHLRMLRNLTVMQLSEILGITEDSIRKLERGDRRMTVEGMIHYANTLNCDEQNILTGLNPQKNVELPEAEIKMLSAPERKILNRMSTTWKGNRKALIILDGVYMALPEERRREIAMYVEMQKDEALKNHEISSADLPDGIEEMQKVLGGMF